MNWRNFAPTNEVQPPDRNSGIRNPELAPVARRPASPTSICINGADRGRGLCFLGVESSAGQVGDGLRAPLHGKMTWPFSSPLRCQRAKFLFALKLSAAAVASLVGFRFNHGTNFAPTAELGKPVELRLRVRATLDACAGMLLQAVLHSQRRGFESCVKSNFYGYISPPRA